MHVLIARTLGMIVLAIVASTQVATAQDKDFCSLEPAELLAALEGDWVFDQGPGIAKAGVMDVPLPDQPPVTLTVEFLAEAGIGFLSGQGQDMIIMPMVPGLVDNWATVLPQADQEKYKKPGASCGWKALRSFIGTTEYVLDGVYNGKPPAKIKENMMVGTCKDNPLFDITLDVGADLAMAILDILPGVPPINCFGYKTEGDMSMTIVARFESPTSGFGHVYFEGKTDVSRFWANAPLTLTR